VIEIVSGASRGIRLLVEEETGIPLVGRVAAGEPLLAQQHIEGHYQVDPGMFKPSADFLLRVSGMSMKDIGILMAICWRFTKRRMCATARLWSRVLMMK
jgi:repressor LexA